MKINQAQFLLSAAKPEQWPEDDLPEVLLSGRSNVGKSSFINVMTGRKALAYVGQKPGMTRLLNFYDLDGKLRFVDAPGYGYQKNASDTYLNFDQLMRTYFTKRKNLKLCILLLDIRRDPSEDDKTMLAYYEHHHLPYLLVLSKTDKLSRAQQMKQQAIIAKQLNLSNERFFPFSALQKTGTEAIWEQIDKQLETV